MAASYPPPGRTHHVDLWVDGGGRPRRLEDSYDVGAGSTRMDTVDLFAFGASVSIELPPPGQVDDQPPD